MFLTTCSTNGTPPLQPRKRPRPSSVSRSATPTIRFADREEDEPPRAKRRKEDSDPPRPPVDDAEEEEEDDDDFLARDLAEGEDEDEEAGDEFEEPDREEA